MRSGHDWIYRPVAAGWLKAESLIDGSIDLEYILELNDAIDVKAENDMRYQDAIRPIGR